MAQISPTQNTPLSSAEVEFRLRAVKYYYMEQPTVDQTGLRSSCQSIEPREDS